MDLSNEIVRLRAELESVTAQRDLLLCEVSNLRRELELSELKHIQDESFTHKVDDEEAAGSVVLNPPEGFYSPHHGLHHHMHSSQRGSGAGGGSDEQDRGYMEGNRYVAQQHRSITGLNHSNSSCSSTSNTSSNVVTVGGSIVGTSGGGNGTAQVADAGGGPPLYITAPPDGFNMHTNGRRGTDISMQQNQKIVQKDSTMSQKRGKMMRGRYEMSQDLLDKQVEILERRYGGLRARRAATTIQRAFRRRQLLKKFSAITAMAKAADSYSRRQHNDAQGNDVYGNSHLQKSPVSLSDKLSMTRPIRSMSLRERHDIDISMMSHSAQNDIELMAARVQQSANQLNMIGASLKENNQQASSNRSDGDSGVCSCSVTGSVTNISTSSQNDSLLHHHMHLNHSGSNMSSPNPGTMMWNSSGEMIHNTSVNSLSGGSVIDKGPIYGNMLSSGGKPLNSPTLRQQQQLAALQQQQLLARKVPPEVPKRTSSITLGSDSPSSLRRADCCGTPIPNSSSPGQLNAHGSMNSVQSSGSDSSSIEHHHHHHQRTASGSVVYSEANGDRYAVWKRQNTTAQLPYYPAEPNQVPQPPQTLVPCCAVPVSQSAVQILRDDVSPHLTDGRSTVVHSHTIGDMNVNALKVSETVRKRQYRVGLNLFNKKPERGIAYLISRGFLENSPRGVARFLITRKGLSKQMIGEYLGNLQNSFNMAVLECFVSELELSGMQVDVALRRYQAHFRLPGEAQKIERLVEAFARRYCACNLDVVQRLRTHDTIFVLAFAIIMLNTDLHTPNLKPEARMSLDDFIKNLRGIDDCGDIDREMLTGIYDRVKTQEFRPGSDHVTQVMKVQATIVGKKPHLALPHRRLVCYCRLYEIPDIHKKERPGVHQREVFLFNDLLVITKIFSKKKSSVTYTFRQSFPLCGMIVTLFSVPHYPFGIRLSRRVDGRRLSTFNARNEHDRCKFAEDLRESVAEMDDMDTMRIEGELSRNSKSRPVPVSNRNNVVENRDSGVADVDIDHQQCTEHLHSMPGTGEQHPPPPTGPAPLAPMLHHHHLPTHMPPHYHAAPHACHLQHLVHHTHPPATTVIKRNVLSNSLVDINDPMAIAQDRLQRRGSVGSLDSGMSVSFHHSPSTKTIHQPGMNQMNSPNLCAKQAPFGYSQQRSPQGNPRQFLGGVFQGRTRKLSASGVPESSPNSKGAIGKSTEVMDSTERPMRRTRVTNF